MITVVGLGFSRYSISAKTRKFINESPQVVCRTVMTPPSRSWAKKCKSFDYLYVQAKDYDMLNSLIADEIIKMEQNGDVVYCVDGDGFKDRSVMELALRRDDIKIIAGPFDLPIPPSTACAYLSAYDIDCRFYPDTSMPLCIYNIDDRNIAGDVKLYLMRYYDAETKIMLGSFKGKEMIALEDLDRQKKYSYDTTAYIQSDEKKTVADLLRIMDRLVAVDGCPWDKAQTHDSIRVNLLEEAYEAVDAITKKDYDGMIEELGDVLLQVVFHANIAERHGEFTFEDVLQGINRKLITRHTHIFGKDSAGDAGEALGYWEKAKAKEKNYSSLSEQIEKFPQFSSLLLSQKIFSRIKKLTSVDKEELADMLDKAILSGDYAKALFVLTALASLEGKDAEVELLSYCDKVKESFKTAEKSECKKVSNIIV